MTDNKEKQDKKLNIFSLNKKLKEQSAEADDRLSAIEETVGTLSIDINNKFAEVLKAINNPVIITKDGIDSRNAYKHEDEHGIVFADGRPEDDVQLIEKSLTSVNSPEFKEKAEQMKFDHQLIQIMVMASMSTYPDHVFTVGVNGKVVAIHRGLKQWLPRNIVEVLLRAKVSTYANNEVRNIHTNELEVKNPETKSHRYPLQILTDRDPKGAQWLERVSNDVFA